MFAAATAKAEVSLSAGDSEHHLMASMWKSKTKSKNKMKKRFSDEQIRLLESMFETESRPELQRKQQLANELGLHPRQVAIWFQNKRARSKSKLIEQEYNTLKSSYNALASKFDSVKKENLCLLLQVQRLRNLMGKPQGSQNHGLADEEYNNTDTNSEAEEKSNGRMDCEHHEIQVPLRGDSGDNLEYNGEEADILNMGEILPEGSFTSSGNWCSFEPNIEYCCVLDHLSSSSQWWDV